MYGGTLRPEPNFAGHRTEFWGCPGKAATNWIPTPVITIVARNNNSSNRYGTEYLYDVNQEGAFVLHFTHPCT